MRFMRYVSVQVLAYAADMGVFLLLVSLLNGAVLMPNIAAKICAGALAFTLHRAYTFKAVGADALWRQLLLYTCLLALNVPVSSAVLLGTFHVWPVAGAAKFLADAICVLLTYRLSKHIVFRVTGKSPQPEQISKGAA